MPVNMITDPTANAVDMAMARIVPLTAACSVPSSQTSPRDSNLWHVANIRRAEVLADLVGGEVAEEGLSSTLLELERKSFHRTYQSPITFDGWFQGTVVFTLTFKYASRTSVTAPRLYD